MKEVNQLFLGTQMHQYVVKRNEGNPVIPCDVCMGGWDAPWWLGFYVGEPAQVERGEGALAYVICAASAVLINQLTDTCGDCIPDPTDDRVCDNCGKEYRRAKKPAPTEVAA